LQPQLQQVLLVIMLLAVVVVVQTMDYQARVD
jgi:hypothetical protein